MRTATDAPRARVELRLGTGVFLGAALLLALTVGLGILYAGWKARRVAEERVRRELASVPAIYDGSAASQSSSRLSQVLSLVEEPGTRALFGEGGAGAETAHDAALGYARALGAGAVFLFDAKGALISRSDRAVGEDEGRDFRSVSWVKRPLAELAPATAMILEVSRGRRLSLVASAPVTQGERSEMKLNGVLAAAFPVDDERAREIALLASGHVVFLANVAPPGEALQIVSVAASDGPRSPLAAALLPSSAVRALFVDGRPFGPFEISAGDATWIGTARPIASGRGEPIAAVLVARDKAAELAPFLGISEGIAVVGLAILLLSFPVSLLLARRASRPIEELAEAAAAIGEGRAPRLPKARWKEVGSLTRAFEGMANELARRDEERRRAEEQQKRFEEHVRQSQRIEAVGRLAGGIAHDFNNVLTVIQGTASLLVLRAADDEELRADAAEIVRAAERASGMTRQLLAFSRRQSVSVETVDLVAGVGEMRTMLRRLIGENVELATEPAADPLFVRVDRAQLEQVVMNLVVNARDAMPQGGRVTIATAAVTLAEGEEPGVPAGRYARLVVKDTGAGMPPEVRAHVFEPFFTTKPSGKGTGLGLATVYGIVRQSDGFIHVASEPGQGTTFTIHLPIAEAPEEAHEAAAAEARGGDERVLVVEDEEAVRRLARRVLAERGYRVLEAGSGDEALRLVAAGGERVDLVLTDVVMPGMSGPELERALAPLLPGVPVLFMSAHADDALPAHGVDATSPAFLRKPLAPADLARKVREHLDRRAPTAAGG